MSKELKPCPKCNGEVHGKLCGGRAAYGCMEWEYEVECSCGILFDVDLPDVPEEEAEHLGIEAWNKRYERTTTVTYEYGKTNGTRERFGRCKCGAMVSYAEFVGEGSNGGYLVMESSAYCSDCGAKVVDK